MIPKAARLCTKNPTKLHKHCVDRIPTLTFKVAIGGSYLTEACDLRVQEGREETLASVAGAEAKARRESDFLVSRALRGQERVWARDRWHLISR